MQAVYRVTIRQSRTKVQGPRLNIQVTSGLVRGHRTWDRGAPELGAAYEDQRDKHDGDSSIEQTPDVLPKKYSNERLSFRRRINLEART